MKIRQILFKTNKNPGLNVDIVTRRFIQGCFIKQEAAGIFQFTTIGLRLIQNICTVIRNHISKVACEVQMPLLQDLNTWKATGRDQKYGQTMWMLKDRRSRDFCLAPTCEEYCTNLVKHFIDSYKQLPITVFQISEKFRDELRPRYGIARSREFLMKDAYSYARSEEESKKIYVEMFNTYVSILEDLEMKDVIVYQSDPAEIGGDFANEFLLPSIIGENYVLATEGKTIKKVSSLDEINELSKHSGNSIQVIEIAEIFFIGTIYSEKMQAFFRNENDVNCPFFMGCYGIGIGRIAACLLEKKQFLPMHLAPFQIFLVGEDCDELYNLLLDFGSVLWDDRDKQKGDRIMDGIIIGCPICIIYDNNKIQFHHRLKNIVETFNSIGHLKDFLSHNL